MKLMNKIKVVITHPSQLFERWVNYYCMDTLADEFQLEYWDCSNIVTPSYKIKNPTIRSYVKTIESLKHFESSISKLPPDTVLISEVYQCAENYDFHKIQSTYFPNILHFNFYGNIVSGITLEEEPIESKTKSIKSFLYRSHTIKWIIKWFFHHNDSDFKKKKIADKCRRLYKGQFEITCQNWGTNERINHPDFENYLNIKKTDRLIADDYIVFIDTYYPWHSESFFFGEAPQDIDDVAERYYKSMNEYFEMLEDKFNIPVVIAAHPYANYRERNPFKGRKVYYYQTDKLIKDCRAVCMHGSNAFSYVALFNKPVSILINSAIRGTFFGNMAELSAQKFHLPLYNTDNSMSLDIRFDVMREDLRMKYINKYLGELTHPKSNKQLIISCINNFYTRYC